MLVCYHSTTGVTVSREHARRRALSCALAVASRDKTLLGDFIAELFTHGEAVDIANRWAVAVELLCDRERAVAERRTYRQLSETLGVATGTVTRVAGHLNHGRGSYEAVWRRLRQVDTSTADEGG